MNTNHKFKRTGFCLVVIMAASVILAFHPALARDSVNIVRTLVSGSPMHGSNGIQIGPDGNLYIASFADGYITVMNPDTGRIIERIYPGDGMDGPDDLTFGPDGSLYWTAILSGKVGKMEPDGTQSLFAQLPPGVNPITFSEDGRLFVGLDFLGDALYEVYFDGTPPRLIRENLGFFNAFDFGPDGYLYGPLYLLGKVVKVDVETGDMYQVADGFAIPVSARFDSSGEYLFVADQGTGEIIRLHIPSGGREVFARLDVGLDNMAFDEHDQLYVSSAEDGTIFKVLPNGKGLVLSPGGLVAPGGLAVVPGPKGHDHVYVADLFVLRSFNGQTGQALSADYDDMWIVQTIAADGDHLIITSWPDNIVWFYDMAAETVVGARDDFNGPMNAVRFEGDLIVSELYTGKVVRSSGPGDYEDLVQLALPVGLAHTDDDLYVADWALGSVFQIVKDGAPVFIPLATGLAEPEGLAVMPDGTLLVVESGAGQVSQINPETLEVTVFADGLELGGMYLTAMPPFWIFNGIAVNANGTVYVSGDSINVLYRIDQRP